MTLTCSDCPAAITIRSTTGRCRSCFSRRPRSAQFRERASIAAKQRWQRDLQDPTVQERMRAAGWRVHANPDTYSAETNQKRNAAITKAASGWCPPAYREENQRLRKAGFTIGDRKRMIGEQISLEARRVISECDRSMRVREQRRKAQAY